jgi:hypothetical protein
LEGGQGFRLISILGFVLERRGSYDLVGIIGIFGTKLKGGGPADRKPK